MIRSITVKDGPHKGTCILSNSLQANDVIAIRTKGDGTIELYDKYELKDIPKNASLYLCVEDDGNSRHFRCIDKQEDAELNFTVIPHAVQKQLRLTGGKYNGLYIYTLNPTLTPSEKVYVYITKEKYLRWSFIEIDTKNATSVCTYYASSSGDLLFLREGT